MYRYGDFSNFIYLFVFFSFIHSFINPP